MRICIDTTILIDILKDEYRSYQDRLYAAMAAGEELAIPSVVYAELLPQFEGDTVTLDEFLKEHKLRVEPLDIPSVISAATSWMTYLTRKGKVKCPQCGHALAHRAHFLSDFYIGGFASARCDAILTRDRGIFRTYFPELAGYDDCL